MARGDRDNDRGGFGGSRGGAGSTHGSGGSRGGEARGGFGGGGRGDRDSNRGGGNRGRGRSDRGDHGRGQDKDTPKQEAPAEDKGVMDSISDWASDAWQGAKDWATGKEDTGGFSPMGGASSYGMSKKTFDETIGKRRYESMDLGGRLAREIDYFQEAPMDYASDLLDNPLVSGAALMTGLGVPAFGVKVVDAAMDVYQNEEDPLGALGNVGAGALQFTAAGAAIPGPLRSITKAGLKAGPKAAAVAGAGVVGGKLGGTMGTQLASALTDNPYARAGITAASAAGASWGGMQLARNAATSPTVTSQPQAPRRERDTPRNERSSPLVSSGEKAIRASERLMQPADTGLYARTVQQLPYYGLNAPQQQLPYYGV